MRRAHHRQERIDRERNDCRRVADAKKWDEKAEHRDRWYCIKEINYAKRRCRRTLIAINENARRTADDDGNADRRARNPKVLDHQLQEKCTALREDRDHSIQQIHDTSFSKCNTTDHNILYYESAKKANKRADVRHSLHQPGLRYNDGFPKSMPTFKPAMCLRRLNERENTGRTDGNSVLLDVVKHFT